MLFDFWNALFALVFLTMTGFGAEIGEGLPRCSSIATSSVEDAAAGLMGELVFGGGKENLGNDLRIEWLDIRHGSLSLGHKHGSRWDIAGRSLIASVIRHPMLK
ncbi:hypothetical protein B0O99DRAFT_589600 [Bisporella sp. PMI_857]|nr:hypothetical protein B0O99DRAFT_589600 [Bisporella sp. PMI_857]